MGTAAAGCTGTATHFTYYLVNLSFNAGSLGTQTLSIPLYIDPTQGSSNLSDLFGESMTFCLAPTVPSATGGAPAGAQVMILQLAFSNVLSVAPGWYQWDSLSTAYGSNGAPDPTTRAEAQSEDRTNPSVTAKVTSAGGGKLNISGRLVQGGVGVAGQTVSVFSKGSLLGKLTTSKSGAFTGTVSDSNPVKNVRLQSVVPTLNGGACQRPWFSPYPCTGLTIGGFIASAVVPVRK
jgi:hypothetical protein